jgi:hypothetical protein
MTGPAAEVFYLAICQDCTPILPQPFFDETKRDQWLAAHVSGTGHRVRTAVETRA